MNTHVQIATVLLNTIIDMSDKCFYCLKTTGINSAQITGECFMEKVALELVLG
jgi:hypothetical protein